MTTYPLLVWLTHLVFNSDTTFSTSITPIDILQSISVRIHTDYCMATYPFLVWLTHLVIRSYPPSSTFITPIDILLLLSATYSLNYQSKYWCQYQYSFIQIWYGYIAIISYTTSLWGFGAQKLHFFFNFFCFLYFICCTSFLLDLLRPEMLDNLWVSINSIDPGKRGEIVGYIYYNTSKGTHFHQRNFTNRFTMTLPNRNFTGRFTILLYIETLQVDLL